MATYNMMVDNGYRLEFNCQVEAESPMKARDEWKRLNRGCWEADMVAADPKKLRAVLVPQRLKDMAARIATEVCSA